MNVPDRLKPYDPFAYSDQQWDRMCEIVGSAGGGVARDKFTTHRVAIEERVAGWLWRIKHWNGEDFGSEGGRPPQAVVRHAKGLLESLTAYNFPAVFCGRDTSEFRLALKQIAAIAEQVREGSTRLDCGLEMKTTPPPRKDDNRMRDWFVGDLAEQWRDEFGLRITAGASTAFVRFAVVACEGVCLKNVSTSTVVNIMAKWPRNKGIKNDA